MGLKTNDIKLIFENLLKRTVGMDQRQCCSAGIRESFSGIVGWDSRQCCRAGIR